MSIKHTALNTLTVGLTAALIFAFAAGTALGAGGSDDDDGAAGVDPNYTAAVAKIEAGDHQAAIALLESVVAKDPDNADAYNYLGYTNRKLQRYPVALGHYNRALALDPNHRGAHEYIGELFLETGDLAKAEEHLAALDRICFFGCAEYDELKELVEAYRSGRTVEQSMRTDWRK